MDRLSVAFFPALIIYIILQIFNSKCLIFFDYTLPDNLYHCFF